MFKYLFIIISLCYSLVSIANENTNTATKTIAPEIEIVNIFNKSIQSLTAIQNNENKTVEQFNKIIESVLLPRISIKKSVEYTLKNHLDDLTKEQKKLVADYIINSLINDYSTFLVDYKDFDKLELIVTDVKLKSNRAQLTTDLLNDKVSTDVALVFKMINDDGQWNIYDLSVAGVSLMRSFKSEFSSIIRRKGLDFFLNSLIEE